jgi:hypothetical protein
MGSTITSLIYASFTFLLFSYEASIMSMALHSLLAIKPGRLLGIAHGPVGAVRADPGHDPIRVVIDIGRLYPSCATLKVAVRGQIGFGLGHERFGLSRGGRSRC